MDSPVIAESMLNHAPRWVRIKLVWILKPWLDSSMSPAAGAMWLTRPNKCGISMSSARSCREEMPTNPSCSVVKYHVEVFQSSRLWVSSPCSLQPASEAEQVLDGLPAMVNTVSV